jgi:hypothetical protein
MDEYDSALRNHGVCKLDYRATTNGPKRSDYHPDQSHLDAGCKTLPIHNLLTWLAACDNQRTRHQGACVYQKRQTQ